MNSTQKDFWETWPEVEDTLHVLALAINRWAKDKGFQHESALGNFGEKVALMHSELSEALEADRTDSTDAMLPQYPHAAVELADAIIRILDECGQRNWPIGEILCAKMAANCKRVHKHGKKY